MEMVELKKDGPLREMARELKERACLLMEEIVEVGGYFNAVQEGFFVDSAKYPERNGDGIARKIEGGVGYGYIFERAEDYMAPSPPTTATTTWSSTAAIRPTLRPDWRLHV